MKAWADVQWAELAREHMRWLMLTVAVEKSRADHFEAATDAAGDKQEAGD